MNLTPREAARLGSTQRRVSSPAERSEADPRALLDVFIPGRGRGVGRTMKPSDGKARPRPEREVVKT